MDDVDEQVMKINSKKKYIENKPASRVMPIFGGSNNRDRGEKKKPTAFGFVPVNKNEEEEPVAPSKPPIHEINTITKMFKNAPPPKPKRVIGDVSEDDQEMGNKKRKIEELKPAASKL